MANFCNKYPIFLHPNIADLRYDNFVVDNLDTPSTSTPTAYYKSNIRLHMHMHIYTELPHKINIRQSQRADTYRANGHGNIINSIQSREVPSHNVHRIIVPIQSIVVRMLVFT